MTWRNLVVALAALCLSLPMAAGAARAQADCPRSAATVAAGASLTCRCSEDSLKAGAVFGSARYTDDSLICRAALHAGAVKESGGTITVHGAEGCPSFVGSSANAIRSNNWGQATAKTFAFAKPAPACGLATVADALKPGSVAATAPAQAAAPAGAAPKPTGNPADACPANAMALAPGTAQTCTCAADKIGGMGFLYGTARYTPDSSICRAAAHAGAIAAAGGPIVFHVVEGCPGSTGSDSNGIKSTAWGSPVPKTVVFAHPAPACGLASVAAAPKPIVAAGAPVAAPANVADCPRSMNAGSAKTPGQTLTCNCTADAVKASGSIYGIERYSFDSNTCRAARHVGKVGDAGGVVTVHVADGCPRFEGAERNGVASNPWSSAVSPTFAFAAPPPACVAGPVVAAKPAPTAAPAAPAGPPPGSPMAGWQKRADAYGAALPDARAGWTAAKPETEVSDSAMTGQVVAASRLFRLGKHPVNLDSIMIAVANNPDGSARYPIELWNDEAKRTAKGFSRKQIGGRDAMEGKSGDITELWFLLPNNLFVSVSWQEPHVPRDQVDAYVKAIDFAKIGALVSK